VAGSSKEGSVGLFLSTTPHDPWRRADHREQRRGRYRSLHVALDGPDARPQRL